MVFFTGTLQEGISTALQQSKLVVCFVTDNQEESKTWETEYLTDQAIASSLESGAVVLRLEAGSEEAGYLAAIFPLPKNPTLVIIKNGQLKEYVSAGTSKDDFVKRVSAALSAQTASQGQTTAAAVPIPSAHATTPAPAPAAPTLPTNPPAATPSGQQQPSPGSHSAQTTALLTEAERRREAARKEREEMEKERRRKEKGKMPAAAAAADPKAKQQQDAVKKASQQLAERQRQAREERARVLKLIEDDKAERRARQERERAERQASARGEDSVGTPEAGPAVAAPSSSMAKRHDQCAIQVRLFDGLTIRTRFPAKATLAQDVRKWIDENRTDGKEPYTFKVILTPMPNRAVDHATEEEQTLEELGLTPSSTLVLTPVDRYSSAYTSMSAGLSNPVSRLVTAVLAFVVNILGGIAGALGGLGSGASVNNNEGAEQPEAPQQDRNPAPAATTGRDGSGRIKGFQNPDDKQKDYQLYNGNSVSLPHNTRNGHDMDKDSNKIQLNFEPRKDEDDKDK